MSDDEQQRNIDRRRDPRVDLEIVLHVNWEGSEYDVRTRDVSAGGAMIDTSTVFPVGSVLRVSNPETGEEADFRVAWVWPGDDPGQYRVGLELVEPADFWGDALRNAATAH